VPGGGVLAHNSDRASFIIPPVKTNHPSSREPPPRVSGTKKA
jgi:hypothetical protein